MPCYLLKWVMTIIPRCKHQQTNYNANYNYNYSYTIFTTVTWWRVGKSLSSLCKAHAMPQNHADIMVYKRGVVKSVIWPVPLRAVVWSAVVYSTHKVKDSHTAKVSTATVIKSYPVMSPSQNLDVSGPWPTFQLQQKCQKPYNEKFVAFTEKHVGRFKNLLCLAMHSMQFLLE